jgi:hypothetical protein
MKDRPRGGDARCDCGSDRDADENGEANDRHPPGQRWVSKYLIRVPHQELLASSVDSHPDEQREPCGQITCGRYQ